MIVLIWIINFLISWFNAWGCGKTWAETRINGGFPHFMNWCGAIMSASGFTWCYMVIMGFLGATIPFEHEINGKMVVEPYLSGEMLTAFADLGYIVVIFPILGSGIAILVHSWGVAWRERTIGNIGVAGWNTFAMGSNIYDAVTFLPGAFSRSSSFFKDSENKGKTLIFVLVLVSLVAGILTTRWILLSTMKKTVEDRRLKYYAEGLLQ